NATPPTNNPSPMIIVSPCRVPYASCRGTVSGANLRSSAQHGRRPRKGKGKGNDDGAACNRFVHFGIRGVMMRNIAIATAALLGLLTARPSDRLSAQSLRVPYQTFTLPNGLQVLLHEDHSVPLVAVNMWYHVGSADEKPGRTGFAHLFEHIMFMGSHHVPTCEIDQLLDRKSTRLIV